jgi:hypothetical protein
MVIVSGIRFKQSWRLKMSSVQKQAATVHEVASVDLVKNTFDGKKADLYINTGQLGGKHFLVTVQGQDGQPKLIAIHL